MKAHTVVSTLFIGLPLLLASANAKASSPERYDTNSLPLQWVNESKLTSDAPQSNSEWWKSFNDTLLDSLIQLALDNNYSLDMAARRMTIAQNTVRKAQSGYFPAVNMSASWLRSRTSGMNGSEPGAAATGSYWSLGMNLTWEVDLFGKITARVKEQQANFKATKAEYEGAMLALTANVATSYVQLRVWQAELLVAREHIERQLRVVKITEDRLECGLGTMLDVTQARGVYYSTMASIPKLESSIHAMITSIATLAGVYPDEIRPVLEQPRPLPDFHELVPIGVPADLLRRRPDIVEAEMNLSAYAAALGIAKKDFLPTLTINGSIGTSAHSISNLFDDRSFSYSIAPTLTWTLFDGLERKYNNAIAKEQLQSGIDNYNNTVLTAIQDVDNAMSSYSSSLLYIDAIEKVLEQSDKSLKLSLDLYKSSLTQFSNVVDAQMSVLENQNSLIVAHGNALVDIINLYEALGGGWNGNL